MPASANPPAANARPAEAAPALSFEAAMERLEAIVEQMENARLPLEELIQGYEEGTRLIKVCSERLQVAEQRIEIITRDAAGQARVVEFTPPAGVAAATAPKPVREPKTAAEAPTTAPSASRPTKTPHEVSLF